MVNIRQELYNYSAINLDNAAEGAQISDNVRNSIILYNKALGSLKNDSEDMAIIELKKAVSLNPDFPEAMNLLGLCYIYMQDYAKASAMFDQVAVKESSGVKAQKYLNMISSNDAVSTPQTKKRKNISEVNEAGSFITDIINIKGNWKKDIIKYLAGIIAGALIMFAVQAVFLSGDSETSKVSSDIGPVTKTQTSSDMSYESKYKGLLKDYEKAQSNLKAASAQVNYYQSTVRLKDVESLISQRKYEEAADLLVLLKSVKFQDPDKKKFDDLNAQVMPDALWNVLGSGINLYSTHKYAEAIQKLNKVALYDNKWQSNDRASYYIAKSYEGLNDTKNAIAAYQKVVDNYPSSIYTGYSKGHLGDLTQKP